MAKKIVTPTDLEPFRNSLSDGDTLYFILDHISASGLARFYNVYAFPVRDGRSEPHRLTWGVSNVLGYSYDRKSESIRVNGCGFSAENEITHDLVELLGLNLNYRRIG